MAAAALVLVPLVAAIASCGSTTGVPGAIGSPTDVETNPNACGLVSPDVERNLAGLGPEDVLYSEIGFGWERVIVYADGRVAILDAQRWATSSEAAVGAAEGSTATAALAADGQGPEIVQVWQFPPMPVEPLLQVAVLPQCALEELAVLGAELVASAPNVLLEDGVTFAGEDGLVTVDLTGVTTPPSAIAEMRALVRLQVGPAVEVLPDALKIMGSSDGCEQQEDPEEIAAIVERWRAGSRDVPDGRALVPGMIGCDGAFRASA